MAETPVVTPPVKETPTPPATPPTDKKVETPAPEKVLGKEDQPPVKEAPKPPDPKPPEQKVPENYDLKLSEGSLLNESIVKEVAVFAKENGLSNEDAQVHLERREDAVKAHVDSEKERLAQQSDEWMEATKTDPEIGGEKYDESCEIAKRGLDSVASPEFRKALVDTGLGNHPEVIRVFRRVGILIGDDKLVDGKIVTRPKTQAERMFPKEKTK